MAWEYKSSYGGESSAFGIAAIGNVANDTINLIRKWIQGEEHTVPNLYAEQKAMKEKKQLFLIVGGFVVLIFILK